ncbi:MAG: hypothetical protein JRN01_03305 [Nitrososphaerota archaeon]|nr:hypothetical protein [Nitrososphaerota archaeon]
MQNHSLARAVHDAAWSVFWQKMELEGKKDDFLVIGGAKKHNLGMRHFMHRMLLSERIFVCPNYGFIAQRDLNASMVILQRGLKKMEVDMPKFMPVETGWAIEAGNKFLYKRCWGEPALRRRKLTAFGVS